MICPKCGGTTQVVPSTSGPAHAKVVHVEPGWCDYKYVIMYVAREWAPHDER